MADYQYQRIESFLNKDSDSQSSKDDKWQQENSILAIGSGGLTGKGFNDNGNVLSVKEGNFLPESHTDFIFAIVGEELGLSLIHICGLTWHHAKLGILKAFQNMVDDGLITLK